MKKLWFVTVMLMVMLFAGFAFAAEVNLTWDTSPGATGYKLYMSTDSGQTWTGEMDVAKVITYAYPSVPDSGLVLFRVSAYNSVGESIRYWSGAWYCGDWKPVESPGGAGIE